MASRLLIDDSGPRPVVAGTDIKVSQIAAEHEQQGMLPGEIVEAHPHLSLVAVEAALAYFADHPGAVRREWDEDRELVASLQTRYLRSR